MCLYVHVCTCVYECVREIPTEEHHFRAAHTMEDRGPGFYSRKYGICVRVLCVCVCTCMCVCLFMCSYMCMCEGGHLHRTIHACSLIPNIAHDPLSLTYALTHVTGV